MSSRGRGVTDRAVTALKVLRGFQRLQSETFRIRFLIQNGQESAEKFSELDSVTGVEMVKKVLRSPEEVLKTLPPLSVTPLPLDKKRSVSDGVY